MEKIIPLYMLLVIGCVLFVALKSVLPAKDWRIGPEESQLYQKEDFLFYSPAAHQEALSSLKIKSGF